MGHLLAQGRPTIGRAITRFRQIAGNRHGEAVFECRFVAPELVHGVIEIAGRKFFHTGISGGIAFEQHLVLIISLLGALIGLTLGMLIALGVNLSGLITAAPSVSTHTKRDC